MSFPDYNYPIFIHEHGCRCSLLHAVLFYREKDEKFFMRFHDALTDVGMGQFTSTMASR